VPCLARLPAAALTRCKLLPCTERVEAFMEFMSRRIQGEDLIAGVRECNVFSTDIIPTK
jgi:hypothetical protein